MNKTPAKWKWRLGIRGKFALVTILLVLGAGFYALRGHLFPETKRIVVEHELVDLADEADLRCWEMLDSVNQLRSLADRCAVNRSHLDDLLAHLVRKPGAGDAANPLPRWYDSILAVRVMGGATGGGELRYPPEAWRIALPEIPPECLSATLMANDGPHVSRILEADLPVGYANTRTAGAAPAKDALLLRVPVMWGLCQIPLSHPPAAVAILLPLERTRSSRHLSFLLDEKGNFLQHPALRTRADEKLEPPFPDKEKGLDLMAEVKTLSEAKRWTGQDSDLQVQRGLLYEERTVAPPYHYLEGEAEQSLRDAILAQDKANRLALTQWSDVQRLEHDSAGVRFGGAGMASPAVRLLARSEQDLKAARQRVDAAYGKQFQTGSAPVHWHTTKVLESADAQLVRFYLHLTPDERGGGEDPAYYFVYVAFRDELAASVNHEFREVQRTGLLLGLAAGGVAFLVAFFFVRPLRQITQAAQRVTDGSQNGEASRLQHQIESVRQSLPTARRDEVGDIARALESLLRQVINGHERLRQLNADLEDRVEERTLELSEANTELRGLAAAKDAFLASVSHELRQPLNSIFGYLQFLECSTLDEEQAGDVKKVRMASTYLRRLIDDILDYQKIIMGGIELDPEPVDAAEFFTSLRDAMKPQAAERGNQFVFKGTDNLGSIHHDRARLQQIFVNLLSNACKFTEAGEVALTAARETDAAGQRWLMVSVADSGRGMTPEEQKLLFTKFKKLAAREGNKTGTGLGLVICKGLCELMGGSIHCESEFGRGTTFTVRLPADLPGKGEAPIAPVSPPAPVAAAPAADHALVLVVDDDAGVRELMQRFLEGKGFRVLTAADGEEGLALARRERPAVITLDVVLPGQDGWEVLAALKSAPETADIPVVMVTFIEERAHGYTLGAADYLVKPVAWEDLSARLSRLIGAAHPSAPVLVVDDDADTRELFRRALEQDGRTVIEAADGAEALAHLATQRPGLILLDLMMPVMDGFEFVEEFRLHAEWQGIPIVVVTAKHPTAEDRARLSGSVRTILEKGGSPSGNLLADILALIHRHAPMQPPPSSH